MTNNILAHCRFTPALRMSEIHPEQKLAQDQ